MLNVEYKCLANMQIHTAGQRKYQSKIWMRRSAAILTTLTFVTTINKLFIFQNE